MNTALGRNLDLEMSNAVAQPTTRTCAASGCDKAECIPLWGGRTPRPGRRLTSSQWAMRRTVFTCVMVN